MAEQSAKSFLGLLERSGIVDRDQLKQALGVLASESGGETVNSQTLTSHLIDAELITPWHVEKIRSGKYKGFFLGKFKLLGLLGSGGMSSVYLAEHCISKKQRAIKVLPRSRNDDQSYLDRFYREGRAAASLDHRNVVRVYDICEEGDTHYMVMEYVRGSDLYELVKADGPLEYGQAASLIAQAATGMQHAHDKGLVHRDVKPANLLLTDDGIVKILDLGLALVKEQEEESLTVMHNEKVMGTADYLSPEQAINSHQVDHRADIYSLGCTLYYLLTAKPPFSEGSLAQRIAQHQTTAPPSIKLVRPDCPDALLAICQTMMEKKPDDRYQQSRDIANALESFAEDVRPSGNRSASKPAMPQTLASASEKKDGLPASGSSKVLPTAKKQSGGQRQRQKASRSGSDVNKRGVQISLAASAPQRKSTARKVALSVDRKAAQTSADASSYAIDVSAVEDRPSDPLASRIIRNTNPHRVKPPVVPKVRARRRKQPPLWLVPVIITAMLGLLIGVLLIALSLSG